MKENKKANPEVIKLIALANEPTQESLAQKLGTSQSRISEYKNGKKNMSVEKLKTWCKKLNINIKDLF